MGKAITTIAFDCDDTLWNCEDEWRSIRADYEALLQRYCPDLDIGEEIHKIEMENLNDIGYGVRGLMINMTYAAIRLTKGKVSMQDLETILDRGKEMLSYEIELLPHVEMILNAVKPHYQLMAITKGDLLEQENKFKRSGIEHLFDAIEIVSEKDPQTYSDILKRRHVDVDGFFMVGNSPKSDVLPVADIGARAAHVPYHLTWRHETVSKDEGLDREGVFQLKSLKDLPALLVKIDPNCPQEIRQLAEDLKPKRPSRARAMSRRRHLPRPQCR